MNAVVIDDDPIIRMLASKMLEVKGFSVSVASDQISLEKFLSDHPVCPDVILLDLQIGDLMGPEALQLICARYATVKKIICMSSHKSHEVEELFPSLLDKINLENSFLQKPFQSAQLYAVLEL